MKKLLFYFVYIHGRKVENAIRTILLFVLFTFTHKLHVVLRSLSDVKSFPPNAICERPRDIWEPSLRNLNVTIKICMFSIIPLRVHTIFVKVCLFILKHLVKTFKKKIFFLCSLGVCFYRSNTCIDFVLRFIIRSRLEQEEVMFYVWAKANPSCCTLSQWMTSQKKNP